VIDGHRHGHPPPAHPFRHQRIAQNRPCRCPPHRQAATSKLVVRGGRETPERLRLRPFLAAGRAYQVAVTGRAGAVDTEIEPTVGEAHVPVDAAPHRDRRHIALTVVGPVTNRARGTPRSVATTGTPRQCSLTHASNPFTSKGGAPTAVPTTGSQHLCFQEHRNHPRRRTPAGRR